MIGYNVFSVAYTELITNKLPAIINEVWKVCCPVPQKKWQIIRAIIFEKVDRKLGLHSACLESDWAPPTNPHLCVSVPLLPFRRTSLADEQQLRRLGQSGIHGIPGHDFIPGFPPSARGGQRDAPLDSGSVSVKSDKENETEKRRSVASRLQLKN